MRLTLPLEQITSSNTGFVVPADAVAELGGGKRPPVLVTVAAHTLRLRIAPMGERSLIGLTKAHQALLGVEAGQSYDVRIELDTAERTVEIPDDLAAALRADERASTAWHSWSYTKRKEAAHSLTDAKKPETRERRLAAILTSLGARR